MPKGFILSCSLFVGRSPTESKQKIQGLTPTDRESARRLSSARGENIKKIIFTVLAISFLSFGSCCLVSAQDVAQSDEIKDGDTEEIIQADSTSTGSFETVTVDASANSDVKLQFPVGLANKTVAVGALDGGTLTNGSSSIGADGSLSFSCQVSDQPGVHRVIVIDPNADEDSPYIIGVVQFEVPSPAN